MTSRTTAPTSPERPSALPPHRKRGTHAPRCAVVASSDRARRVLGMLALNAAERIELATLSWAELAEQPVDLDWRALVADVDEEAQLGTLIRLRAASPAAPHITVVTGDELEASVRASGVADLVLGRPLHASRVVEALRRGLTEGPARRT